MTKSSTPQELTIQDRRKFELLVKSGSIEGNIPFRAPVYSGYYETYKALSKQGLLGFYKGNFLGISHSFINSIIKVEIYKMFRFNELNKNNLGQSPLFLFSII